MTTLNHKAKVHYIMASMNAGKTTRLCQEYHNIITKGKKDGVAIKPLMDSRDTEKPMIVARIKEINCPAILIDGDFKISDVIKPGQPIPQFLFVDELHLFKSVRTVDNLFKLSQKYGTIVLAYGLRTDFLERKFKNVIRMEEKGAKITTMYSTCINKKECISKATHVVRLDKPKDEGGLPIFKGAQKVVGHNYEPMCLDCYEQAKADWKMRTKKQRNQK